MDCLFALIGNVLLSVDASLKLIEGSTNFLLVGLDSVAVAFAFLQGCLESVRPDTKLGELNVGRLSDFLYVGHGLFFSNSRFTALSLLQ